MTSSSIDASQTGFLSILVLAEPLLAGSARKIQDRLLAVGNSFSHNATHYRGEISEENGDTLILSEDNTADQTHSLNVGWNWRKQGSGKLTLVMDGHHINVAGDHLGAWNGTFCRRWGDDVVALPSAYRSMKAGKEPALRFVK